MIQGCSSGWVGWLRMWWNLLLPLRDLNIQAGQTCPTRLTPLLSNFLKLVIFRSFLGILKVGFVLIRNFSRQWGNLRKPTSSSPPTYARWGGGEFLFSGSLISNVPFLIRFDFHSLSCKKSIRRCFCLCGVSVSSSQLIATHPISAKTIPPLSQLPKLPLIA